MSEENGNGRVLTLDQARHPKVKDNDYCTIKQARAIAAEECTKVHEFYLNQIPPFVARMIQDALISYGVIQVQANPEGEPTVGPVEAGAADAPPQDPA